VSPQRLVLGRPLLAELPDGFGVLPLRLLDVTQVMGVGRPVREAYQLALEVSYLSEQDRQDAPNLGVLLPGFAVHPDLLTALFPGRPPERLEWLEVDADLHWAAEFGDWTRPDRITGLERRGSIHATLRHVREHR
jgi:hypothetical protein